MPTRGRGSSKPFLPACSCCPGPSCPSSPLGPAEPALWPRNTLQTSPVHADTLPAQAGRRDAKQLTHTLPAAFCRVPAQVPLTQTSLIPPWKTTLISYTSSRGRCGSGARWAVLWELLGLPPGSKQDRQQSSEAPGLRQQSQRGRPRKPTGSGGLSAWCSGDEVVAGWGCTDTQGSRRLYPAGRWQGCLRLGQAEVGATKDR